MQRIYILLTTLLLTISTMAQTGVGDVNTSGRVTIADATQVVGALLTGNTSLTNDVNCDGVVNESDLRVIVDRILYDQHDYVDLGLTSGTLWATCNLGAEAPEDFGNYYAWGEVTGYDEGKTTFDWSNYTWNVAGSNNYTTLTKYTIPDNRTTCSWYSGYTFIGDSLVTLQPTDDAATANWGKDWRMPTHKQQKELDSECIWYWETRNGVYGYRVEGPNKNSIFLPATGYRSGPNLINSTYAGSYWSCDLYASSSGHSDYAWLLGFTYQTINPMNVYNRYLGRSVRAVRK